MLIKRTQRHRKLLILLALGSLTVMPGAIIAPVLPEIAQHLELDHALAGYLVSAHYLTIAIFSPLFGILAERLGCIRVLVFSAIGFALFGVAGTLTTAFLPMLLTRGLLGVATGGIAAASLGILARMYTEEAGRAQAIAYASTAITLANIAYPLLSGWLGSQQWQLAFYLYGVGIPLAILAALILPDRSLDSPSASLLECSGQEVGSMLRRPPILRLLLTVGLSAAIAYATVVYLPLYLKTTFNSAATVNGLLLACQAIGAAIVSAFGVNLLIRRIGSIRTIVVGLSLMAFGLLAMPQLQQLQWFIPTSLVFGMGMGITMTSHYATIANLAPLEMQTIALATATSMNFLGQFSSPTLFGLTLKLDRCTEVCSSSLTPVFYAAAAVAASTAVWLALTMRKNAAL